MALFLLTANLLAALTTAALLDGLSPFWEIATWFAAVVPDGACVQNSTGTADQARASASPSHPVLRTSRTLA